MNSKSVKQHVLIVDESRFNLQIIEFTLQTLNIDILTAMNGAEALKIVEKENIDLILLSITMPNINGFELCKILKSNPDTTDIPIIFQTALKDKSKILKGFKLGAVDYITKPFNNDELIARVQTHLQLKQEKENVKQYGKRVAELGQEQILLNDFLEQKKLELESKNKDLNDSIDYAKLIQSSLLAQSSDLSKYFSDTFNLYLPKHKVSGDFYYANEVHDKLVVFVADCTGHGVPGAFISGLGFAFVHQISEHEGITNPSTIQEMLNNKFIKMLSGNHQNTNTNTNINNGMDVAICTFDFKTKKLLFSGSKRPLIIIRNNEIIKLNASLYSIGGYKIENQKKFQLHEFNFKKNDRIYMFSDGYADQFGGSKNRKISTKHFYNLLAKEHENMNTQKKYLINFLKTWKNNIEQIDDITVWGLKI